jgi:hypothetical protein
MRVALGFMKYTAGTVYVGMYILYIEMYCRFYVQYSKMQSLVHKD